MASRLAVMKTKCGVFRVVDELGDRDGIEPKTADFDRTEQEFLEFLRCPHVTEP